MNSHRTPKRIVSSCAMLAALAACVDKPTAPVDATETDVPLAAKGKGKFQCDANNAGLTLPPGFCALVFADLVLDGAPARARHMAITRHGDVFVAINAPRNQQPSFGIIGLSDDDGDGRADTQSRFSPGLGGSGIALQDNVLFFGANDQVLRFQIQDQQLTPNKAPDVVVSGLPNTGDHISKTVVVNGPSLFVNHGSASNSCQVENRVAQSPGKNPCDELPIRAGVWRFNAEGTNQTQASGERFATGLRNAVALAMHPVSRELWAIPHGRDQLFEHWPQFFTQEEDAVLPAEEFVRVTPGSDTGWPYCYFDAVFEHKKVLAPEYGGNGQLVSGNGFNCASYNQPLVSFGAHWAPNGLTFYTGDQFPSRYRYGAFIAFHGGFDRAPLPNEGYQVQFVPFSRGGTPTGPAEPFADGFAGSSGPLPATALHRPVGVTVGPDGSLYVSDDRGGRIYRIMYVGN
jgi:glucose/arabinose dehydrogenase